MSFFHLSAPDLLLGFDSPPAERHIFGLAKSNPEVARGGIRLRAFGQQIIATLGGQRIHPAWTAPGGVRSPLTLEERDTLRKSVPEAKAIIQSALTLFKGLLDRFQEEVAAFGHFPTLFLGLVADDGSWEHYGGRIRIVDHAGQVVADRLDPSRYAEYIGEAVQSDSYLKSPYYLFSRRHLPGRPAVAAEPVPANRHAAG